MEIDDIIDFENESTNIEFKSIQYKKETNHELLKDVIGMANAFTSGDRLIILGVKKNTDASAEINPIPNKEFVDSASYLQLINDNIEPELQIEYKEHYYRGTHLVGILRVLSFDDKPYMMKKNYNFKEYNRKIGECFIRKGTVVIPINRKDLDKIYLEKQKDYSNKTRFYFSNNEQKAIIELSVNTADERPSQKRTSKILSTIENIKKREEDKKREEMKKREELERLENARKNNSGYYNPILAENLRLQLGTNALEKLSSMHKFTFLPGMGMVPTIKLEEMTIPELEKELKKVPKDYLEDDLYYVFEKKAHKINISVSNESDSYIEDVTIIVTINKMEGLLIANQIYGKPLKEYSKSEIDNFINYPINNYPKVEIDNEKYIITTYLKNVKHLQPEEIFSEPIRIFLGAQLSNKVLEFKISLFGKNQAKKIESLVKLKVV